MSTTQLTTLNSNFLKPHSKFWFLDTKVGNQHFVGSFAWIIEYSSQEMFAGTFFVDFEGIHHNFFTW